ncbi:hypothetical protein Vadar_018256 [Vaccinium darrowii]|uniref:Uncharacterized protein n=1 Tax=Vaccinium darrowii TaxID=229202 RepID=A0ACB7YMX3_9ERIC|nr:hypothetical protein Vadar_018256 [Vaccinium darrowii]
MEINRSRIPQKIKYPTPCPRSNVSQYYHRRYQHRRRHHHNHQRQPNASLRGLSSGRRISLPPVTSLPRSGFPKSKWDVHKAFMSVTPDSSSSSSSPPVSDCFVMVFYGAGDRVAFCKVGDQNWTKLRNLESYAYYRDAIYYKGRFYIVGECGRIWVSDQLTSPRPKLNELSPHLPLDRPYFRWYLVECGGELYQIMRKTHHYGYQSEAIGDAAVKKQETLVYIDSSDSDGDGDYEREARKSRTCKFDEFDSDNSYVNRARNLIRRTTGFQTFKLETGSDSSESKWIEVKDFEDGAVFIGLNQSFAVSKPDLMGYEGDRIYYTDDNVGGHKFHIRSGHDIGIFSLNDSRFLPLCSTDFEATKPPAVWITPSD